MKAESEGGETSSVSELQQLLKEKETEIQTNEEKMKDLQVTNNLCSYLKICFTV